MVQNPVEVCAVFAHGRQILENCAAITQAVNAIGLITLQQQDTNRKANIQILVSQNTDFQWRPKEKGTIFPQNGAVKTTSNTG